MSERVQLRLPVGCMYQIHDLEVGKAYIITYDPSFVDEESIVALSLASPAGSDVTFVPVQGSAVATERERCAAIARRYADDPHGSNPSCATAEAIVDEIMRSK